jgi:hypothetical protein
MRPLWETSVITKNESFYFMQNAGRNLRQSPSAFGVVVDALVPRLYSQ